MNIFQYFVILTLGDNKMTIYDRIKDLRISQKMSQTDLALKMGYKDGSMITKIESGKVDISQKKIIAFAKALNTTPGYLMGWTEDHPDDPLQNTQAHTRESRFISAGVDKMPPEEREKVLKILQTVFVDYFKEDHSDDA